ncbi:hypothetical protein Ciccas_001226 [Cichlidogyrus casuarinus]|uniref:FERM domain-containing protein n=1 Tax=Cichlidogyrus casuarinus TaxID=1844966 RepID=A0ABD2QKQ7_9PLAT
MQGRLVKFTKGRGAIVEVLLLSSRVTHYGAILLTRSSLQASSTISNVIGLALKDSTTSERRYFGLTYSTRERKTSNIFSRQKEKTYHCQKQTSLSNDLPAAYLFASEKELSFELHIRFYPLDPLLEFHSLQARVFLVHDLRCGLVSGSLQCSIEIHALLCAYHLQAFLGNAPQTRTSGIGYLVKNRFAPLPPGLDPFSVVQSESLLRAIAHHHTQFMFMSPQEAVKKFLLNASKLSSYGTHFYCVKVNHA